MKEPNDIANIKIEFIINNATYFATPKIFKHGINPLTHG